MDANAEGRWYLQGREGGIREFYVDLDGRCSRLESDVAQFLCFFFWVTAADALSLR